MSFNELSKSDPKQMQSADNKDAPATAPAKPDETKGDQPKPKS